VYSGSQLGGKRFVDVEDVETEVQKWLRQQSKDCYVVGFDALIKQWDMCINIGGGYIEKLYFFSRFEYHVFYVLYPFVIYLVTLPPTFRSARLASPTCRQSICTTLHLSDYSNQFTHGTAIIHVH
jgi:hypothetical protein